MDRPRLYIITGLPYSGKTVLSRELLRRFGFGYASVDDEITSGNLDVTRMSQRDWDDVYSRAYGELERLLHTGQTVVFDGGSLKRSERQNLRDIAHGCGADAVVVYVNTSPEQAAARRRRNLVTQERAHLEEQTVDTALAMFEVPAADERPITYNAAMDLQRWLEHNIGHQPPATRRRSGHRACVTLRRMLVKS
jgi:predicted kinase